MSGKRIGWVVLLIGLVGGLLFWVGGREESRSEETIEQSSASDRASLLERKRAAREARQIDLRPCSVAGRVIEEGGGGLAGAIVQLTPGPRALPEANGRESAPIFAVTEGDGSWSIASVRPGTYLISATARGHVPAHRDGVELAPAKAHTGIELALAPGGLALTGTVSDYGGGPIEGVLVYAASRAPLPGPESIAPQYATLTDAEGHYALWLADSQHTISTWHTDYAGEWKGVSMKGRAQVRDFELVPGAVIEGVVVDGSGKPVGEAEVKLSGRSSALSARGSQNGSLFTGSDGKFVFRQLKSGVVELRATAPKLATVSPAEVQLAIGEQVAGVEVVVVPAVDVSGFVVRKDDPEQGIAQARVVMFAMRQGGQYTSLPTEDDGYFVIHGVAPGNYMASANGPGIRGDFLAGARINVEDANIDDALIEVEIGLEIRGRVEPPMAVRVSVEAIEKQGDMAQIRRMTRTGSSYSKDDGTFLVTQAEKGRWKLVATAVDGDGKGEVEIDVPEEGLDGVVIPLNMLPRVSGTVVDLDGNPLPDLRVVLEDLSESAGERRRGSRFFGARGQSANTESDGTFEIRQVEDGQYALEVVADRESLALEGADEGGGIPVSIQNAVGVDGMRVRAMIRRGKITGIVTALGGGPAADVWVTPERKRDDGPSWFGGQKPALTDADGRFELDELEDGIYTLRAEAADGSARGEREDVRLGDDVTIALESPARITGFVRYQGAPVKEFTLETGGLMMGGMGFGGRRIVDEEGKFELERLRAGEHIILVSTDDGSARAVVEVEAGDDETVNLDVLGWAKVTGTAVSAETGEPLAGLKVMGYSSGGAKKGDEALFDLFQGGGKETDEAGKFELDGLGAGLVRVQLMSGGLIDGNELGGTQGWVEAGQTLDLGTIAVLDGDAVPEDERGDLGLAAGAAYQRPTEEDGIPTPTQKPEGPQRLWVTHVAPGGPAAKAGIEKHTEILAVDGKTVEKYGASLPATLLGNHRVKRGQSVQVTLEGGKNVTLVAD